MILQGDQALHGQSALAASTLATRNAVFVNAADKPGRPMFGEFYLTLLSRPIAISVREFADELCQTGKSLRPSDRRGSRRWLQDTPLDCQSTILKHVENFIKQILAP